VAKRANRKPKQADKGTGDLELEALRAENLHLKEEIERLRLRNAGAHPAAALAEAMQSADDAGDSADDALTMYASSMIIRGELLDLLALFKSTVTEFEARLERLGDAEAELAESDAIIELRDTIQTSLSGLDGGRSRNGTNRDATKAATPAAKGA
jgi:hypothetical protein